MKFQSHALQSSVPSCGCIQFCTWVVVLIYACTRIDRQTDRQTDRYTVAHTHTHTHTHTHRLQRLASLEFSRSLSVPLASCVHAQGAALLFDEPAGGGRALNHSCPAHKSPDSIQGSPLRFGGRYSPRDGLRVESRGSPRAADDASAAAFPVGSAEARGEDVVMSADLSGDGDHFVRAGSFQVSLSTLLPTSSTDFESSLRFAWEQANERSRERETGGRGE